MPQIEDARLDVNGSMTKLQDVYVRDLFQDIVELQAIDLGIKSSDHSHQLIKSVSDFIAITWQYLDIKLKHFKYSVHARDLYFVVIATCQLRSKWIAMVMKMMHINIIKSNWNVKMYEVFYDKWWQLNRGRRQDTSNNSSNGITIGCI